ncbi:MAG: PAS domain S-box protein [Gemmatimonadetes bacterium]|nr:PAS domain S-box protein [Gemmatimonadota bacterium]
MPVPMESTERALDPSPLSDAASRAMIQAMSHGAMMHDADGRVVASNNSAARILGLSAAELVGTTPHSPCWSAVSEDGAPLSPEDHPVLVTLRTGVAFNQVVIGFPRPGGRRVWISLNTRPIPADDGEGVGAVVCTFSDFTTRREEVAELERQALVARRTNDAVIITDGVGRIEWVNAAFLAMTGFGMDAALGRTPGELLQGPETDPETIVEMREALRSGNGWHGEVLNYRADGSAFWIEQTIAPAHDGGGQITHFVSIARNISGRREEARRMFQLSAAVGASVDGVALIDSFQDFRFVNDAFGRMMGHERGEALVGKSWRTMYDREAIRHFDAEVIPYLYMHDRWRGEILAKRRDGSTFPQELSVTLLSGGGMVLVTRDISDRKEAEAEQARLTAILEATPDLIAIASIDGDVPYLNAAGRRMIGVGADVHLTFADMFPEWALQEVQSVGVPFAVEYGAWNGETALRTADGREIPVSQVIIAHKGTQGEVEHLSTIMRDITERKEAEDALRKMSLCDQLTGLYNRRGFFMLAQQHLNVARTNPGHAILLYFDLNDFKPINDTYGHAAGDEALKEVAAILHETFRDSDLCGRLGGDEFVALAVNCLDPTGQVLVNRLDERIAAHNAREGRPFRISIGRGVARFDPHNPKSLQQLLDEADARLYEDKRARKAAR